MENDYLMRMKPLKALLLFSLPIIIGNLFQQTYTMVDSAVVGRFVGEKALAAVGASYAFTSIFICIAVGGGIGASVVVSRYFGAREKEAVICEDISGPPPFSEGNPVWAALMLRNLVDNALKYSPAGSEISISVKDEKLAVCNSNTVVAPDRLEHLCERFYRPAGQTVNGSGLGLAIVSEIAAVHGCCTDCANTPNGFCVSVYRKKNLSSLYT